MDTLQALTDSFRAAAEKVSAIVAPVATMADAISYAVNLCDAKEACQLLVSGCESPLSAPAENLCDLKQQKVMAAPGMPADRFEAMAAQCRDKGILLIQEGLRNHLAGIDIGFTIADFGIAETGTLVIDSSSEAIRLATMVSEVHVAVLPREKIRATAVDLERELEAFMAAAPDYLAFITGASRTADIERVLALGVHGPLELHILILEEA
ncbi:MAG: lactate utilization protein [Pseudomonadota bacterium]